MFLLVLFLKQKESVDEVKQSLYAKMKFSLQEYTRTLHEYNCTVAEFGEDSSIASVFYSKLHHFRTEYHELRLQYETLYGDVEAYESSLNRMNQWTRQSGTRLLMRPLHLEAVVG